MARESHWPSSTKGEWCLRYWCENVCVSKRWSEIERESERESVCVRVCICVSVRTSL
jgi:hypothetical protein